MFSQTLTTPFAILAMILVTGTSAAPSPADLAKRWEIPACEGGWFYKPGPSYRPMQENGKTFGKNTWTIDGKDGVLANYDPSTSMLHLVAGPQTQDTSNVAFVVPEKQSYPVLVDRNTECKYKIPGMTSEHVGYHLEVLFQSYVHPASQLSNKASSNSLAALSNKKT